MKVKILIFLILSILSVCLIGCGNVSELKNQEDVTINSTSTNESSVEEQDMKANSNNSTPEAVKKGDDNPIQNSTSDPYIGRMHLDSETEEFLYGTWKVEKLLGFANSYNDASEYPTGQKIIGDEIIINKDFFSSKGLKNYTTYQYEIKNPFYEISNIFYDEDSFYRSYKIELPGLEENDELKVIDVYGPSEELGISAGFFVVNDNRLIFCLEATQFELTKV